MDNITLTPMDENDIECVLSWNMNRNADFLMQWAGSGYHYPLTYQQISDKLSLRQPDAELEVYKITANGDGRMLGTVELNDISLLEKSATVCRFLIAPELQGKGIGLASLNELKKLAFENMGLETLCLRVFEFNKAAIRCYLSAGFQEVYKVKYENGWVALGMEMKKDRFYMI